jgi:large subunit ribosomal protein L21
MKYAILKHGGKQYIAEEGGRIEVDRLGLDVGKPIEFKEVLLITDGKKIEVGSPYVSGAKVKGKVLAHSKAKKIVVFKYKPKQRYRKKQGHRQQITSVSIESVGLPATKKAVASKPKPKASSTGKTKTKRAASKAKKPASKSSGKRSTGKSKGEARK